MFMKKIIAAIFTTLILTSLFAENITFEAERMTGNASSSNSYTTLEGSAKVTSDTMIIFADKIELYGKDFRYIKASGKISGQNLESNIKFSCDSMSFDRETKIATLQDNVQLEDLENDFKASSQIIEYNQELQIAIMQIEVTMTQKNNTCTCAFAIYNQKDQTLEMSGNPKIVQGTDTFRAQNILLNLDTQEITLSGRIKGSVSTQDMNSDKKAENDDEHVPEMIEIPADDKKSKNKNKKDEGNGNSGNTDNTNQ